MLRRPFVVFALVVGALVGGVVLYIQSEHFAHIAKKIAYRYIPKNLGIEGDFSEFSIRLVPPSVSISKPRLVLKEKNILGLPAGSSVVAERIDFAFLPFQMFSKNIKINRIMIAGGDINLVLGDVLSGKNGKAKHGVAPPGWDELRGLRIEGVGLENTLIRFSMTGPAASGIIKADNFSISQWSGRGGLGYEVEFDFKSIAGSFPQSWNLPGLVDLFKGRVRVNPAGIVADSISLSMDGLVMGGELSARGNVFSARQLPFEAGFNVSSDIARAMKTFRLADKIKILPVGKAVVTGSLRGDLARPMETVKAEAVFKFENVAYKSWGAETVAADCFWRAGAGGGSLGIEKLVVESKERARAGGHQSGWGGRIEVGRTEFGLAMRDKITVPLKMERAHIHWLAAAGLKDVYPLNFRISGTVNAEITPPVNEKPWAVLAGTDIVLDDFRLDNQRLGKDRPLKHILKIPKMVLRGPLRVDATGVHPGNMQMALPNSSFQVGGKVDFKTGYDLRIGGTSNLEDVGTLAENKIRGEGSISAHVHGLPARTFVDFEADLKNSFYINLNLGDVKGKVTWDDDPQHLIFKGTEARQGKTHYRVDGMFDFGKKDETVALDIDIPRGTVKDLSVVFENLTSDIWWYPRTLDGETNGKVKISGFTAMNGLEVFADMKGQVWQYLGERFRTVAVKGGYDKGKYYVKSLTATKSAGLVAGRISYDAAKNIEWNLKTENLTFLDIDHVARLDVPIRGKIDIASSGRGREGSLDSVSRISIGEMVVRGDPKPPSEAALKTSGGIATFAGTAFGGQGTMEFAYNYKPGTESRFKASARKLDFSTLLLILNPRNMQDGGIAGNVSGYADLSFKSGKVEHASGKMGLTEYVLAKTGTRFALEKPVHVTLEKGTFDIAGLAITGGASRARLDLKSREARIEGQIGGELDVSVAEFLTSTVTRADGSAKLDYTLGGTIKEPIIFGSAHISGASADIVSVESPFENISASLQLRQSVLGIRNATADLAGGRVQADGKIEFFADRFPKLDILAAIAGSKLRIYPFQFVRATGKLAVTGETVPYLVEGQISVDSGLIKEKVLAQKSGAVLKVAQYTPKPGSVDEGDYPRFKLGINVRADRGIIVQNDLFDAELKANVRIVNFLNAPMILGKSELIHGKLTFKDRVFQIQSAQIDFDTPAVINPLFNMAAFTEISGAKIQLYASGRLDRYRIDLSSNPVMPEAEILQLLALGVTTDEFKRMRAGDRSVYEQGEAASILLHSLDFNKDMEDKTGIQVKIDEAAPQGVGSSVFRPRSETDATSAPKIVIKRQIINKKVDLSVGSTVGGAGTQQKEVNAEVHITPGVSVMGVGNFQESSGTGTTENQGGKTSYGVDLKLQKRFKW
ncbi:MAG: hypothetical protein A2583_09705 [Bdellovibrionales bacterium RIFOXYD1_FULL_53_11]|nr:MAG: hypothetical protein A2583_09705 [Bdellovibrionales bacterium RIFOXYD1_FULL_53_11]